MTTGIRPPGSTTATGTRSVPSPSILAAGRAWDVNVDLYAVSPVFIWVSDWQVLGAKYAAYIAPSFANASIGAALATVSGRGISRENDSEFGVGGQLGLTYVPWLGWRGDRNGSFLRKLGRRRA
jgi:hypothetical protein